MARGRYQQQQWEAREAAILDALGELSNLHGFAQVTMDDLADAVGISKATLYQHFASKDDLLVSLMARHTAQFVDWLHTTTDQPPLARLRLTMHYLMEGEIAVLRGLIRTSRDQLLPHVEDDSALAKHHIRCLTLLDDIVRQGQRNGTIAADLTPDTIISVMWAISNITLTDHAPASDPVSQCDQLVALFERGIRSPG